MAANSGSQGTGLGTTRAFIAIELPTHVKDLVASHIDNLKTFVPRGVKWVDPGIAHLTLAFLGNVPQARLTVLSRITNEIATAFTPFGVKTGSLGTFPNARRPRVLWLDLEGDTQSLSEVQLSLQNTLQAEGFAIGKHSFKPHVTLGRARGKGPIPLKEEILNLQAKDSLEFQVCELVLMSSTLTARGPIHTPIHTSPLPAR